MKGLLTKDFALLLQRKKTFIFLAIWAVVMCLTMDNGSFVIGWMSIITAFFAISSITYDEYDNCYPFLMSMPINGKIYALEKYVFGFLCGLAAWLFAEVIWLIFVSVKSGVSGIGTELIQSAIFIPVSMLLIDISLPINLKYGSERGRTIILIIWGVVFGGFFIVTKLLGTNLSIDESAINAAVLIPAAFAGAALLTAISMFLSVGIMSKKEF